MFVYSLEIEGAYMMEEPQSSSDASQDSSSAVAERMWSTEASGASPPRGGPALEALQVEGDVDVRRVGNSPNLDRSAPPESGLSAEMGQGHGDDTPSSKDRGRGRARSPTL